MNQKTKTKKIECIIIGNELLLGKIKDANLLWLGSFLFTKGPTLHQTQIIGDDPDAIHEALRIATQRSDLIIITGGLGPTKDDLTKACLAFFFNCPLCFHSETLNLVTQHYQRIDRTYDQTTSCYHQIPQGFSPLYNPKGLAPGLMYEFAPQKFVAAFPGVPREFQSMFGEIFYPTYQKLQVDSMGNPINSTWQKNFLMRTFGVPEEKLFHALAPHLWDDLAKFGSVSSLPHLTGVDIGVMVQAQSSIELDEKIAALQKIAQDSPIFPHIWSYAPIDIAEYVLQKLSEQKISISVAESCTGGLIGNLLSNISGSSAVFKGGIISYQEEIKKNVLNVAPSSIAKFGMVSETVAKEMAQNVQKLMNSQVAISTTGYAGPTGGDPLAGIGTVWIGIADCLGVRAKSFYFTGDRETRKLRFAHAALHFLRMELNL